jgi:hypothetical protein
MRHRHDASSDDGGTISRDCWRTARERNRRRARFAIRQRVLLPGGGRSSDDDDEDDGDATGSVAASGAAAAAAAAATHPPSPPLLATKERVQEVLKRIVTGDRSFFSLPYVQENHVALSTPVCAAHLWEDNGTSLFYGRRLLSWFGPEQTRLLERYCRALQQFTFLEYAAWLRRYHVVNALLLGGINPCVRGRIHFRCSVDVLSTNVLRDDATGRAVTRRFFSGAVPLTLQCHIVKRIANDMRRAAWERRTCERGEQTECQLCHRDVPLNVRLCFVAAAASNSHVDNFDDPDSCHHVFCEACLWKDLLEHLEERESDVVLCPVCDSSSRKDAGKVEQPVESRASSPSQLCAESLDKYLALPANSRELKASRKGKQTKPRESDVPCSTWSQAVLPSLGRTRAVRTDKFFRFIETGSYHHVKGCLQEGIDQGLQNEYGQTALFIAALRGNLQLVQLLLKYGSDPTVAAHGGLTCVSVAAANDHNEIANFLPQDQRPPSQDQTDGTALADLRKSRATDFLLPTCTVETLIDWKSDHPGAGSFVFDDCVTSNYVDHLVMLRNSLPVHKSQKDKAGLCSVRSYFCDAEGWIAPLLCKVLTGGFRRKDVQTSDVSVLPHMRFLCYEERGAVLAPHVDLCRVHPFTGERSSHSFLLYLTDCDEGGETILLDNSEEEVAVARVKPRRGRLLVFPHCLRHEGAKVEDVPKLLIRGEALISFR